jgi:hypothetical protein
MKLKSLSQTGGTVLSPTSQARNVTGNFMSLFGMNVLGSKISLGDSWKIAYQDLFRSGKSITNQKQKARSFRKELQDKISQVSKDRLEYLNSKNVSNLASFNIEQFLMLAGHLFENILTSSVRKIVHPNTPLEIAPHEQEDIIKRTINKKKWNELNYKIPNFTEVRKFLDAVGAFSRSETFVPNAWNSPGINGIAILMSDRKLLKDNALHDKNHVYHKLAKCIATCIAYNLLDFKLNYRCQNKDLMLLYINRIYCVKYNLPMNNGRFKQRNLITLLSWFNKGFQPKAQKELDI